MSEPTTSDSAPLPVPIPTPRPAPAHSPPAAETHRSHRIGWLRALVLGSNDAIVSTASLMIGVAATSASANAILIAGMAGLVAGAMSMAVGEYVSVSSQRDAEEADIQREKLELAADPHSEIEELAMIYSQRGLDHDLAMAVARQLSAKDRLRAHLRDELGIDQSTLARPFQAAWISALSFAAFSMVPIIAMLLAPTNGRITTITAVSLASLVALGAFGARLGGAPLGRGVLRVAVGGALAMAATAGIGWLFGIAEK